MSKIIKALKPFRPPSSRDSEGKESKPDELHDSLIDVSPET